LRTMPAKEPARAPTINQTTITDHVMCIGAYLLCGIDSSPGFATIPRETLLRPVFKSQSPRATRIEFLKSASYLYASDDLAKS
jgi:hypothetical protein